MKTESPSLRRVGVWLRVSTEDQAKGESPQHHEARARAYAEAKGWSVVEVYHLEAVSGKAIMGHPEAERMMRDIRRRHIGALIFSKLARLGRNTRELLEFAEFFQKHQADMVSLQEEMDTSTPSGRFFYTMIAGMAQWEREESASRVAASVPIRAKLGKQIGGEAPYGYQWQDRKLIPHPEEAPVRKLAHELFVEHRRRHTVAKLLNEAGHRTRKGKPFSASTIRFFLHDPTPKGLHRANYMKNLGHPNRWGLKPESDWVYQTVEPILPAELWDQCQTILAAQTRTRQPASRKAVQLFGGLVWCVCGRKMYVPSNTPKYVCQTCRNKIPTGTLEEIFVNQIKGYLLSPEDIAKHLAQADEELRAKRERLTAVEREVKSLRQEMDKTFRLYLDDKLSPDAFAERYRPMEERLGQMNEGWPKLQAEVDHLSINLRSSDVILEEARSLYGQWPTFTPEEKRKVVETVLERIVIGDKEIDIELSYLPPHRTTEPDDDDPETPPDAEPPNGSAIRQRHSGGQAAASPACAPKRASSISKGIRNSSKKLVKGHAAPLGCAWEEHRNRCRLIRYGVPRCGFGSTGPKDDVRSAPACRGRTYSL